MQKPTQTAQSPDVSPSLLQMSKSKARQLKELERFEFKTFYH